MITIEKIKELREKTNVSVMECKNALKEADGDEKKALEILGAKGKEKALKKAEREAEQGLIEAYIHSNNKIGVILELNCETDFVARNEDFKSLAHDIAMHIAALSPNNLEELLKQAFIKDEKKLIEELINDAIAKLGENIRIGEFSRLEI